jgi:tetratricopeptide (TPR) repeat protein
MKHVITVVGLLAGLVLWAPPAEAQAGGARGTVVDDEGKPIAGATVRIEYLRKPNKYEVQTNDKGEYLQIGMEPGPYRITAAKEGYLPGAFEARIGVEVTDVARLGLAPAPPPEPTQAELGEMFTEAANLAQTGRLDEAEAAFKEILELEPGLAEVHGNLGYVYAQREDWARAETSYLAALELRPEEPSFMYALTEVYQDSGQDEKAQELVEQVVTQSPEDATAQLNRGVFLLNAGRNQEAQEAFEAALVTDPSLAKAHYHLGTLLVGQGKVPEAIEHLEAYLATSPDNAQAVATAQGLLEALKK